MKRVFLLMVLFSLFQICTAPNIDLRLRMARYRIAAEYTAKIYHKSELKRFINDLGYRESGNNWLSINSIGCFGEWQFSESTLRYLGYKKITLRKFRANPGIFPREMQEKVLRTLIRVNRVLLSDYDHYIGDTIQGVRITRSGMIAASHLGGAGSLKKFLDTGGRVNRKDVLGTSIYDYLRIFSNYDLE
ncbi:MAG TPA: hypothetical protein VJ963_00255 [Bacteroidales bacterium]|nr:hypothetical protein [Bacteroidales bacterium]